MQSNTHGPTPNTSAWGPTSGAAENEWGGVRFWRLGGSGGGKAVSLGVGVGGRVNFFRSLQAFFPCFPPPPSKQGPLSKRNDSFLLVRSRFLAEKIAFFYQKAITQS